MTGIEYRAGLVVMHPSRPDWGPGRVLTVRGPHVTVYFRDVAGHTMSDAIKTIDVGRMPLPVAAEQSDPWLDDLPLDAKGHLDATRRRTTFGEAVTRFVAAYPLGFDDPGYLGDEREYKLAAHQRFVDTLGGGQGEALLAAGVPEEAARRALAVVAKVNLLSRFEHAALHDGLQDPPAARGFLRALFALLAGPGPEARPFEALVAAVHDLPAETHRSSPSTWTVTTILPFLARPEAFPFLKPEATRKSAEMLGFDLRYDARPNWRTYRHLLRLGDVLRSSLEARGLHPRDWLDLQSFIWLVAGEELAVAAR